MPAVLRIRETMTLEFKTCVWGHEFSHYYLPDQAMYNLFSMHILITFHSTYTAEKVDLSHDMKQWETVFDSEKHFIRHVLAFFVASDGIIL